MERAISEISQLSPEEQDEYAVRILDELAAEAAFDAKIEGTSHLLEPLIRKVQEDYRAGRTEPLDFDRL